MSKYNFKGFLPKDNNIFKLESIESHIHFIIQNCELFDLNINFIKKVYTKYGEPLHYPYVDW